MKNFQQNLLIVLSLALCGLCVYQWNQQTLQRKAIGKLTQTVYEKSVVIRDNANSIATLNHQIAEMDSRITELKETVKTKDQTLASQKRDIARLQLTSASLATEVSEYKKVVDTLEAKLRDAYDGIKKQNESLKQLVVQRDDFVSKYNDSVKERNEIVAKYNDLVAQIEKMQHAPTKQ